MNETAFVLGIIVALAVGSFVAAMKHGGGTKNVMLKVKIIKARCSGPLSFC